MTLGTKSQYAARGIAQPDGSFKTVTKAYLSKKDVKEMLAPAMETDTDDGKEKINFEKADLIFQANRDPAQPDRSGPKDTERPQGESFGDVKTNREKIKLEHDTMDLLKRKGETLVRREVIDACAAAGQKIQEQIKSSSLRLAEKFATMTDVREIKSMMDEEFRKILEAVSDDLERKFTNKGDETGHAAH